MRKQTFKRVVLEVVEEIVRGYRTERVVIHARMVAKRLVRMGLIRNLRGGDVRRISMIIARTLGDPYPEKAQGRLIYVLNREEALRRLSHVRAN